MRKRRLSLLVLRFGAACPEGHGLSGPRVPGLRYSIAKSRPLQQVRSTHGEVHIICLRTSVCSALVNGARRRKLHRPQHFAVDNEFADLHAIDRAKLALPVELAELGTFSPLLRLDLLPIPLIVLQDRFLEAVDAQRCVQL